MSKHKVTRRDTVIFAQSSMWTYPTIDIDDAYSDEYMYSEDKWVSNIIVVYNFMVRRRRKTKNLLLRYHTPDGKD